MHNENPCHKVSQKLLVMSHTHFLCSRSSSRREGLASGMEVNTVVIERKEGGATQN